MERFTTVTRTDWYGEPFEAPGLRDPEQHAELSAAIDLFLFAFADLTMESISWWERTLREVGTGQRGPVLVEDGLGGAATIDRDATRVTVRKKGVGFVPTDVLQDLMAYWSKLKLDAVPTSDRPAKETGEFDLAILRISHRDAQQYRCPDGSWIEDHSEALERRLVRCAPPAALLERLRGAVLDLPAPVDGRQPPTPARVQAMGGLHDHGWLPRDDWERLVINGSVDDARWAVTRELREHAQVEARVVTLRTTTLERQDGTVRSLVSDERVHEPEAPVHQDVTTNTAIASLGAVGWTVAWTDHAGGDDDRRLGDDRVYYLRRRR